MDPFPAQYLKQKQGQKRHGQKKNGVFNGPGVERIGIDGSEEIHAEHGLVKIIIIAAFILAFPEQGDIAAQIAHVPGRVKIAVRYG